MTTTELNTTLAGQNYEAQEAMFADIVTAAAGIPAEQVAEELGISVTEAAEVISGARDLTLTEIRLLATSLNLSIGYDVTFPVTAPIDVSGHVFTRSNRRRDDLDGARTALRDILTELGGTGTRQQVIDGAATRAGVWNEDMVVVVTEAVVDGTVTAGYGTPATLTLR